MALANTVVDGTGISSTIRTGAAAGVVPGAPTSTRATHAARRAGTPGRPEDTSVGPDAAPPTRCRCGHDAAAHEHYRPGTDCGACGAQQCGRFRPVTARRGWLRALGRMVRRGT